MLTKLTHKACYFVHFSDETYQIQKMKWKILLVTMIGLARGFQHSHIGSLNRLNFVLMAKKSTKNAAPRIGDFWEAKMDGFRPTINDVERISWGKPAKQKGTGSRGVPHRLNAEERNLFDQARRKGFLELAGSGWRSQRREAPLLNSFRSLCDARGQASIVLHKGSTGIDELYVDISPLRTFESFDLVANECMKQRDGGEVFSQGPGLEENEEEEEDGFDLDSTEFEAWDSRPIYQLPPYCVVWELPRAEAKELGKKFAELFDTAEGKKVVSSKARKPVGVKPGKGRRHGGYGIG